MVSALAVHVFVDCKFHTMTTSVKCGMNTERCINCILDLGLSKLTTSSLPVLLLGFNPLVYILTESWFKLIRILIISMFVSYFIQIVPSIYAK